MSDLSRTEIRTLHTLMPGSPPQIDTDKVLDAVAAIDGVTGVHHAHFWQMEEHKAALDTHVVIDVDRWDAVAEIKRAIKAELKDFRHRPHDAGIRTVGSGASGCKAVWPRLIVRPAGTQTISDACLRISACAGLSLHGDAMTLDLSLGQGRNCGP